MKGKTTVPGEPDRTSVRKLEEELNDWERERKQEPGSGVQGQSRRSCKADARGPLRHWLVDLTRTSISLD